MRTKKHTKRIIGLLMALVLVFSMSSMALAAPQTYSSSTDETFSITVTGAADGETYNAYKIFDVTYTDPDSEGNISYSYTIDSSSAWYSVVAAATDVFTLTQVNRSTTYIVTVKEGVEDDAVIAVFTNAEIDLSEVTADATVKAEGGQAVLDVTSSGPGYYYVTTSLGSLVIIDTTNPTQTIEEKNGIPEIDKWVLNDNDNDWEHEDDASNNTNISFKLDVTNINGAVNLVIHDAMDAELSIPDTSNFHLDTIMLYTSEDAEGIVLTEDTDYTIHIGECTVEGCTLTNCLFEIQFLRDFDDVDATGHIELTYTLHLDTTGDAYAGDVEEIDNYAQVTFGTSSHSEVTEGEAYSFGFETFKYTGSEEALAGVEFALKNGNGENASTAYFLEETVEGKTIYLFEGWAATDEDVPSEYTTTLVTGSDGMLYVEGLDTGTYYLEETQALDGYNPLTGPVTVEIWAEYDETGAVTDYGVKYTYNNSDGEGIVNIENNTGSILPGTGGIGTTIFYIIGIIIVAGVVVLLITRRRMNTAA